MVGAENVWVTPFKIRVTLDNKVALRSTQNPERYIIILDGKELEIASLEAEYHVDFLSTDILSNVITALKRLEGTVGIKNISVN